MGGGYCLSFLILRRPALRTTGCNLAACGRPTRGARMRGGYCFLLIPLLSPAGAELLLKEER